MFSAKQEDYWYLFYNVFDWGLNPGPPALEFVPVILMCLLFNL